MKYIYIIFMLYMNLVFSQKIEVYNESIFIYENQILFNKISYSIKNDTNDNLLFYKPKQDFRFNNSMIFYKNFEYHDNINDFDYILSPKLMVYNSKKEKINEDEFPPSADHSLVVLNEDKKSYSESTKTEKFENFIKERLIILKPNDTYFYVGYVSLPEYPIMNNMYAFRYTLNKKEKYTFNIKFEQSKDYIEKFLPSDYINKLKKEKIKIFDGVIDSDDKSVEWINK